MPDVVDIPDVTVPKADVLALCEAAFWAFGHFANTDQANACIHCAPVRYSPITFRLAEAVAPVYADDELVQAVLAARGRYPEDKGRE